MTETAKRVQEYAAHSFHTWSRQKGWKAPLLVNDAEGIYFYDDTGKAYIDFSSQLMCSNLGGGKVGERTLATVVDTERQYHAGSR